MKAKRVRRDDSRERIHPLCDLVLLLLTVVWVGVTILHLPSPPPPPAAIAIHPIMQSILDGYWH